MIIVSNMYPNEKHPSYGIFVKKFCDELRELGIDYSLSVMEKHDGKIAKALGYLSFYIKTFLMIIASGKEIVYVHYASFSGFPVLAARLFRKFRIYTNVHGTDAVPVTKIQKIMAWNTKKLLSCSDKIIVPSEYFRTIIYEKYNPLSPIYVYPSGGIDPDIFYKYELNEIKAEKQKYKINNHKPTFGMACRIIEGKGWDDFVEAVARLKIEQKDANFILIGSGTKDRELAELIEGNNLKNVIIRKDLINQNELAKFYNAIDYYCNCSRLKESLGLGIIEAMSCGKPVISSDFASPHYIIQSGKNGYKYPAGDPDELKNQIKKCIQIYDSEEYIRLSENAIADASVYHRDNVRSLLANIFGDDT